MSTEQQDLVAHPTGEQAQVDAWSATADTFAGWVRVEWDTAAPVTPLGQLAFFIDYLKQAGLFDAWVADCPLRRPAWHGAAVGAGRSLALRPHHLAAVRSGEAAVPSDPTALFAGMFERLSTDRLWAGEYEDFVRQVSFADRGELIGFDAALAALRDLVVFRRPNLTLPDSRLSH